MALGDGLQAYYKFDGSLADATPNARNLSGGSPTYTAGILGQALASSSGSERINDLLSGGVVTGSYSISCWLRFDGIGNSQAGILVTDDGFTVIHMLWELTASGSIILEWLDASVTIQPATPIGSAFHLAVVVNAGTITVYINNAVVATETGLTDPAVFDPLENFRVNVVVDDVSLWMDELGIWSRALSPSEIGQLYGGGAGLAYPFAGGPVSATYALTPRVAAAFALEPA